MPKSVLPAESHQAIIIGAGQAGVALSYCLQQLGVEHLVLERDRPFSDWYRRRWDSFAMNTPNWMNALPGETQPFSPGTPRNGLGTLADAKEYFEGYLHTVCPPIRIEQVESVGENRDGSWQVVTDSETYRTENLAICTGHASQKRIPAAAASLPSRNISRNELASGPEELGASARRLMNAVDCESSAEFSYENRKGRVSQLHSSEYQRPEQITTSNVLVVGSGSSGVQICAELAGSSRFQNVYLSKSGNFVLPWSVFGIPTYSLMRWLGVFKITRSSWLGQRMFRKLRMESDPATPPSPRQLAKKHGVKRTGRVETVGPDAVSCSDGQIVPLDDLTIVWCTGFSASYNFLDVYVREAILDADGYPKHRRGVAMDATGLFFVGLRFQHTFISQDIGGGGQDAQYIAERIAARNPRRSEASQSVAELA